MRTYMVEPYVVAADVYAVPPHAGRGGWTWYTGSAGWMYRLLTESLLGITRQGDRLRVAPRLPAHWPGFRFDYRYGATTYAIEVRRGAGPAPTAWLDGRVLDTDTIALCDDAGAHRIEIELPPAAAPPAVGAHAGGP
jgi:cellobiose phosphorylase